MEGNKDESEKCLKIARKLAASGDKAKAIKFVIKADKLYPSKKAQALLSELQMTNGSAASGEDDRSGASGAASNGSPAGAAGSTDGDEPNVRQRWSSENRPNKKEVKEPTYTQEQMVAVNKVRKCKDYYEILGLTKECDDDDLKKAYRKLAMKLHPDKNQAPGATEAFKAISNAFSVLSDTNKRQRYDQYGVEDTVSRSRHSHGEHYDYTRGGFEGDISAEELFNMFFGGAFPSGNVYTRRHHVHRTYNNHRGGGDAQNEPAYTLLLQLAPILFLVLLSLLSSFLVSDPPYSLVKTERYHIERKTANLNVPYYVKPDFSVDYRGSMRRLEQQIEDEYISNLRSNCFRERSYKENMLWRARNFNDVKLHEKAQHLKTPSCETLQGIYS